MKIGVFGGSFNPPHNMHLKLSEKLIKNNIVDKVIFVPNQKNPYHDKDLIHPSHRFNMVKLLVENHPNVEVSDIELIKEKQMYTYETLDAINNKYPKHDIILIIGTDNLKELNKWGRYDYILNNYKIVVVKRDADDIDRIITENNYPKDTFIQFEFKENNNLSSTYIRDIIKNNRSIKKMVPKNVCNYIIDNDLYQETL